MMKKLGLCIIGFVLGTFIFANPAVWLTGFLAGALLVGLILKADSEFFNKRLDEGQRVKRQLYQILFKMLGRRQS